MKPMSTALVFSGLSWGLACSSEAPDGSESSERIPVIEQEFAGTMPAQKGLVWERDEGFLLSGHTVPTVLALAKGFLMFASAPERGQISIHRSSDGIDWELQGRLDLNGLPEECAPTVLDVSVQRVGTGYRVVVETWLRSSGLMDPSGQTAPQEAAPTVFCALESSDGNRWVPQSQALRWPELSRSWPSGLEFLDAEGAGLFYYVDTYPELDGIRMGMLENGEIRALGGRATLLPEAHVDPMPVPLEGGGVRMYHSRSLEGILAVADSPDGQNFGESRPLEGLSGQVCYAPPERPSPPDACYLDPSLVKVADGRYAMYFSVFESLEGGVERRGIARAFSVD